MLGFTGETKISVWTGSDPVQQQASDNLIARCLKGLGATASAALIASLLGLGAAGAEEGSVAIELNKLEPQGQQCRAYLVIQNKSTTDYSELKLDLVLFRPDGVIGRRFAVELAPLKANKRTVKLFDLEATPCDEVGSFLINDVMECKAASGPVDDCLQSITTSTLTNVQLNK
jgi:hypothetical protein